VQFEGKILRNRPRNLARPLAFIINKTSELMKYYLIIPLFFITNLLLSQENNTLNFIDTIRYYDISPLLTLEEFEVENGERTIQRPEPLGYIGNDFQRFYIRLISVIKNPDKDLEYFVYGKTKVKSNVCTFQGLINLNECKTYINGDVPGVKQGFVKGVYQFYENPNEKNSGFFKGQITTHFYIDKNDTLKYDALMFVADGYKNNQFEGIWSSYDNYIVKNCNWGDFRIPDSRNFDIGAGEFSVNKKYIKNGWESYYLSLRLPNNKWWVDKE